MSFFHFVELTSTSFSMLCCRWDDEVCSHENFTSILTEMGKCYVFNSEMFERNKKRRRQRSPGTNKGLRIVLDTRGWQYTEELEAGNEESGIKIAVRSIRAHFPSLNY